MENFKSLEFEQVTTRGGDSGESSLYDGTRRRKDDLLFEAMGDVDELSSNLGVVKTSLSETVSGSRRIISTIFTVQKNLRRIGAMIATPAESDRYSEIEVLEEKHIAELEKSEHDLLAETQIGEDFVLPGDSREAAVIDVARSVCRRAERRVVSCIRDRSMTHLAECQSYLNRLSDYLFILARHLAK